MAVQFQQHRAGVGRGDFELLIGGEVSIGSRWELGFDEKFAVGKNTQTGRFAERNEKVERRL